MFIDAQGLMIDDGSVLLGNRGMGPMGTDLERIRFEPGLRRPYLYNGKPHVTINVGYNPDGSRKQANVSLEYLAQRGIYSPVANASLLPRDVWVEFDRVLQRTMRQRLRAWADARARVPRSVPNAMGKLTLEYNTLTDVGEAQKDMDGLHEGRADKPPCRYSVDPLPIIHSDFYFSEREIAVSRNGGNQGVDTIMMEMATRRCLEMVEKTLIGTETGMTYGTRSTGPFPHEGTSTEYGYTNFPFRVTKTDLHTPSTTNPEHLAEDLLEMRETMRLNGFFGPYLVYHSTGYDRFFDDDYFRAGGTSVTRTTRERLEAIEDIEGIRRLDHLTSGYQLIMVQMDRNVVEAISGMEFTTVMWELKGGLEYHFKVMGIQVPLLKAPPNGIAGIIHGTTS